MGGGLGVHLMVSVSETSHCYSQDNLSIASKQCENYGRNASKVKSVWS